METPLLFATLKPAVANSKPLRFSCTAFSFTQARESLVETALIVAQMEKQMLPFFNPTNKHQAQLQHTVNRPQRFIIY
eukprot:scaffold18747_cov100-Skeletonema_dohrnii-CCMP3373.AAC.1